MTQISRFVGLASKFGKNNFNYFKTHFWTKIYSPLLSTILFSLMVALQGLSSKFQLSVMKSTLPEFFWPHLLNSLLFRSNDFVECRINGNLMEQSPANIDGWNISSHASCSSFWNVMAKHYPGGTTRFVFKRDKVFIFLPLIKAAQATRSSSPFLSFDLGLIYESGQHFSCPHQTDNIY